MDRERDRGREWVGRGGREEEQVKNSLPLGASMETFSVVSSEDNFGGAPTGRPILVGPILGDKMARYQKERRSEPEKWRLIAGRQSGIIRTRKYRRQSIFLRRSFDYSSAHR